MGERIAVFEVQACPGSDHHGDRRGASTADRDEKRQRGRLLGRLRQGGQADFFRRVGKEVSELGTHGGRGLAPRNRWADTSLASAQTGFMSFSRPMSFPLTCAPRAIPGIASTRPKVATHRRVVRGGGTCRSGIE